MTRAGSASARRSSAQLADSVPLVTDVRWQAPSACAGWRVIDVVAHLGALVEAVDPPAPDPSWPDVRERYQDMRVDERRSWGRGEVLAEWEEFTPRQLMSLDAVQEAPQADEAVGRRLRLPADPEHGLVLRRLGDHPSILAGGLPGPWNVGRRAVSIPTRHHLTAIGRPAGVSGPEKDTVAPDLFRSEDVGGLSAGDGAGATREEVVQYGESNAEESPHYRSGYRLRVRGRHAIG
jgi:hypothetical protein